MKTKKKILKKTSPKKEVKRLQKEEFEIEHDVPIQSQGDYAPRWGMPLTFDKMEINDSIFIPLKDGEDYRKRELTVRSQVVRFASCYGQKKKFKVKKYPDGFRVWRVQ